MATDDGTARLRLRLDLAYDGSDFHGWAAQPGGRSVHGTVEHALCMVLRAAQTPTLTVDGRTHAYVHTTGHVALVEVTHLAWAAVAQNALRRFDRLQPHDG